MMPVHLQTMVRVLKINDFRFICINNNNNTVIEEKIPTPPVEGCTEANAEDRESCFEESINPANFKFLTDTLASPAGLTVEIDGQDVTLRSFADICKALEGLTVIELNEALRNILTAIGVELVVGSFFSFVGEAVG